MSELKFSTELWGGVKTVYERWEEGHGTVTNLIKFFLQCGTIESEYAKRWEKLALKTTFQEKGTVGTGLDGLRDFVDALSKEHNKVFSTLQTDITSPLEVTKKNQSDDKSMLVKKITELEKNLEKGRQELQKSKQKYYKLALEYELSCAELDRGEKDPNIKPKDLNKLRTNKQQLKQDSDLAHQGYKQQVNDFKSYQIKYEEQMKKHLEDFQDMEFKRIQKLKELLEIFVRSQEQLVASFQASVAEVKKSIVAVNDKKDIDTFVLTNKTNLVPEELVQYEAYQSQLDSSGNLIESPDQVDKSLKRKSLSSKSLVKGKISKNDSKMDLGVSKSPESDYKKGEKKGDKGEKKPKSAPVSTGAVIASVESGEKDSSPRKDEKKSDEKSAKIDNVDVKAVEGEVKVDATQEVTDGSQTPKDKKRRKSEKRRKREAAAVEGEKKDDAEVKSGDDKATTDEAKGGEVAAEVGADVATSLTKEERKEEREKRRREKKEREEKEAQAANKEAKDNPKEKKEHGYSHIQVGTKVRAMFDYTASDNTELSFKADDFITVVKNDGSIPDWLTGELNGQVGLFPANYIEAGRFCVVLFEFVAENAVANIDVFLDLTESFRQNLAHFERNQAT
eukprot:TRINITY_DN1132_c0_g1_i2.p1 TRINITY_DN1132_c0_g1~~TRINITY_DN1132_c0_g1_i2.p1  ORF type:complete len:620 (+),score=219.52 TRINITY_DN1132_c0_g1_i2:71-1930(+)